MADTVPSRLAHARQLSGLSARALGKRAGIAESHVSAIEIGTIRNPSVPTLQKLAEALGASLAWLLLGEGAAPTERSVRRAARLGAKRVA